MISAFLRRFLALSSAVSVLCLGLAVSNAWAALDFGISPARKTIVLKPGETKRASFRVLNSSANAPLKVTLEVKDVVQEEGGTMNTVPVGTTPWSAASWIKLLRQKVLAGPGKSALVGFDVQAPVTAKGGATAAIVAESIVPQLQGSGRMAFIHAQIPFLVYVDVAGTENYKASIVKVKKAGSKVGEPFKVFYTLQNDGNILIRPTGTLTLTMGSEIRKYNANPKSIAVMPGHSRVFVIEDPKGSAQAGVCNVNLRLNCGGKTDLEATGDFDFHK